MELFNVFLGYRNEISYKNKNRYKKLSVLFAPPRVNVDHNTTKYEIKLNFFRQKSTRYLTLVYNTAD